MDSFFGPLRELLGAELKDQLEAELLVVFLNGICVHVPLLKLEVGGGLVSMLFEWHEICVLTLW